MLINCCSQKDLCLRDCIKILCVLKTSQLFHKDMTTRCILITDYLERLIRYSDSTWHCAQSSVCQGVRSLTDILVTRHDHNTAERIDPLTDVMSLSPGMIIIQVKDDGPLTDIQQS